MQLLDSCPLLQPQFASLSILLQLNSSSEDSSAKKDINPAGIDKATSSNAVESSSSHVPLTHCLSNSGTPKLEELYVKGTDVYYHGTSAESDTDTDTDNASVVTRATILAVHYDDLLEPYYTIRLEDGREKQTDNSHISIRQRTLSHDAHNSITEFEIVSSDQNDNDNMQQNECLKANKSAGLPRKHLSYSVLRQDLTVITPFTLLSKNSCQTSLESLHWYLMNEKNMKDDYLGIGQNNNLHYSDGEKVASNNQFSTMMDEENTAEEEGTTSESRRSSRVRFRDGTKEGSKHLVHIDDGVKRDENMASDSVISTKTKQTQLPVRVYRPPSQHTNCSLGLLLHYVTLDIEDFSHDLSEEIDCMEIGNLTTLQRVASVLLPNVPLVSLISPSKQSTKGIQESNTSNGRTNQINCEKQSAVVLLTVGTIGPAYDLYGSSSVIATLPFRLQDAMVTLATIDTTPKMGEVLLPQQSHAKDVESTNSKKSKKAKAKMITLPYSGKGKGNELEASKTLAQSMHWLTTSYDSAYFNRLYMALLSTLIDDEDGSLRENDCILTEDNPSDEGMPALQRFSTNLTASTSGLLSGFGLTSSASGSFTEVVKRKRFIFSRGGKNSVNPIPFEGDVVTGTGQGNTMSVESGKTQKRNAADIVRCTALQMEILSLVEDEMALPRYEHLGESIERRKSQSKPSPKLGGSGGGGATATISSGRFGRKEVPFDLSGFEYRPQVGGGMAGSVTGTASTSIMATSSDEASIMTGDETAGTSSSKYIPSSQSTIPTLSKPKRDSTSTSSRSKFVQKRKHTKASSSPAIQITSKASTSSKPPRFPQEMQIPVQQVFDPFGHENECEDGDGNEAESVTSTSTKDTLQTPTSPSHQIMATLSRSFSEEGSEGMRSLPGESTSSAPFTPKEDPEQMEAVRHLHVDVALNEDMACEYKKSKLSSITVDGTVQVRVQCTSEEESTSELSHSTVPFQLVVQDNEAHIKALQENKNLVEQVEETDREYTYAIAVPRKGEYFPVVRYKCASSFRPVPIRVQSRVRILGNSCRVALQISSNPQNTSDLIHLTIIMGVPPDIILGNTVQCNPPGGTWNEAKQVVLWCVSELGGGEKFQLQAIFELKDDFVFNSKDIEEDIAKQLEFPVLAKCQCLGAQLSEINFEVRDIPRLFPAEVSKNVVRRFRISHKES